jgi:DNA primase
MELCDLIESIDILEYISQFVDLEQRGDEWWGLSCFREEKTPSFSVRTNPPVFYDYSSGIGGNVFTFVRFYNKCSPKEAVEILKKYAGIDGESVISREKLAATVSCKKYRRPVRKTKESKGILLQDDYMNRYEDRSEKLQTWIDEGISSESLKRFTVKYDSFSDRLVYPIRNLAGKIVNIGGRSLDPEWKSKGLRKYTYFYGWGTMDTIYGLFENMDEILKKREVILFEGCKSVLLADTWGIKNTAAALTSHINPHQMKILAKLGCRVVIAFDKEVRARDDHNIQLLKNYVEVEYLWDKNDMLSDKDAPVDKGKDVFLKLYEERLKFK